MHQLAAAQFLGPLLLALSLALAIAFVLLLIVPNRYWRRLRRKVSPVWRPLLLVPYAPGAADARR